MKSPFTESQMQFIIANNKTMTAPQIASELGCKSFQVNNFRRSISLRKTAKRIKVIEYSKYIFNVDAKENWVA